ncbi:hypothetical protein Y032_0001g339 [Ancylostoma ceylanicum]|uniref:USP domain-containing protein n=1 Tax=Ancylostoma ceylanicum TaxID=53326 RepID=A0A016W3Q8_9BILA|nr:hypothetical protein Y032_0001g339 [Ancylostoma ceylanicum]
MDKDSFYGKGQSIFNSRFEFNDSCVSEIAAPADPTIGRTPYMLVYRRQQAPADGLLQDANVEEEMEE